MRPLRLAYLVTHPIQYQAPLLRRIAAEPDIELTALFESDFSTRQHVDAGFGRAIAWDVKLLDGFRRRFLPPLRVGKEQESASFFWPLSSNLGGVLRQGDFDALWVHGYNSFNHLAALALAKRYGMRTLLRDDTSEVSRQRSTLRRTAKRTAFAMIDRLVDTYLAVGTSNARHWQSLGVAASKIVMMPYAVDGRLFSTPIPNTVRARFGIAPEQPIVLFAAKLIERKRPFDLLHAHEKLLRESALRPALIFAGDGELFEALQAQAANVPHVHLAGFQSQRELAELYQAADIMVLPSEWEPWGLVVNEAMCGGCAIIVSDRIGAAPDLVRDNGVVYPVGDGDALTKALREALSDRGQLQRMRQRSREIISQWGFEENVAALRQALRLPPR